LRKIVSANS